MIFRNMFITILAALLFVVGTPFSFADVAKGKSIYLKRGCTACHGPAGKSANPTVYPNLAGKNKSYLIKTFKDYQTGKKKNALMNQMSKLVQPDEIDDLMDFVASL